MKWLSGFVIVLTIALALAEQARYDNYRVYTLNIGNNIHLETLKQIENNPDGYNFWDYPSAVGQDVKIMVAPHKLDEFSEITEKLNIKNNIFISNVQEKIDGVQPSAKSNTFAFTAYQTLEEIYSWLDDIVDQYPDVASTIIGGSTYEGRQIRGVKLSFKEGNSGVFIEGTMHAREWISGATATYILNELLTSTDPAVVDIAENFDWYIFPVTNPDGYAYTHSNDRMWRKTRTPYTATCYGADPNRNWGYQWYTGGSSNNPCSDTYAGPSAFSEIETKSLSEYYKTLNNMTTYVSYHSYSQLLLIPFGYTTAHLMNYDNLMTIGEKALTALTARHGTTFKLGNIAETIYVASGGSIDWVRAIIDTPLTYCYELRDLGQNGFLLPANQIIPVGEEMVDSLVALLNGGRALNYH